MGASTAKRWTTCLAAVALSVGQAACSDDGGADEAAFCRQVQELPPLEMVIDGFTETDATELGRRLDDASDAYTGLRDVAPEEIRGSVDEVVELVLAILGAVEANPDDPEAASDELRTAVVEHPDAAAASKRVVDYAADRCDVTLDPTLDVETTTTSTVTSTAPTDEGVEGTGSTDGSDGSDGGSDTGAPAGG